MMANFNPHLNKCRLCGTWECDRHTGPMMHYSTRHYAHLRCGCVRFGVEWLDKQPDWIIQRLPWFAVRSLGIETYVRARLVAAGAKEASR